MKIVIAPDSYKGSMSALEVARHMEQGILRAMPDASITKVPMADGGEGTVEAFVSGTGGEIRKVDVTGPLGEGISSSYGVLGNGRTAVIEMAAASGLTLVPEHQRNPMLTTSYGTGELIRTALHQGCTTVIIGIGGSATNDGGMGLAQALGIRFLDRDGQDLGTGGRQLEHVHSIDLYGLDPLVLQADIRVACDVTNPLLGATGAARVYGPQKGATPSVVEQLEKGMANYADKLADATGKDIRSVPGAGAAGGLGAGLMALLGARLVPGFDLVSEAAGLEELIRNSDLVMTGEGRTDEQTAYGKVPMGIAAIARRYQIPVVCLSGGLGEDSDALYDLGITSLFSIVPGPMTLTEAIANSPRLVEKAAERILRLYGRREVS